MDLEAKLKKLDKRLLKLWQIIYQVEKEIGEQKLPPKLKSKFKFLTKQEILIIKNRILGQETHFNIFRAQREQPTLKLKNKEKSCSFCQPLTLTPEDTYGRIENDYALSASNLVKVSGHHSLIIFKNHHQPKLKEIEGAFNLAFNWFNQPSLPQQKILIWNYLWRAGASINHPHFQVLALTSLPSKLVLLKQTLQSYKQQYQNDYLVDLFNLHQALGLAKKVGGLRVIISLTPFKEKEIIFFSSNWHQDIHQLAKLIINYQKTGIESFNLFLFYSGDFYPLGFLVDRGSLAKLNCDLGTLELYAFSVVSFNPFNLASQLFKNL